ncbi:hypothetical protein BJ170DRAFT_622968 [Xylariales sp. AK1849]|nr:hypothetical protein BJ170DRAFT_622968 [Xylariales sp. AK1849]
MIPQRLLSLGFLWRLNFSTDLENTVSWPSAPPSLILKRERGGRIRSGCVLLVHERFIITQRRSAFVFCLY